MISEQADFSVVVFSVAYWVVLHTTLCWDRQWAKNYPLVGAVLVDHIFEAYIVSAS